MLPEPDFCLLGSKATSLILFHVRGRLGLAQHVFTSEGTAVLRSGWGKVRAFEFFSDRHQGKQLATVGRGLGPLRVYSPISELEMNQKQAVQSQKVCMKKLCGMSENETASPSVDQKTSEVHRIGAPKEVVRSTLVGSAPHKLTCTPPCQPKLTAFLCSADTCMPPQESELL